MNYCLLGNWSEQLPGPWAFTNSTKHLNRISPRTNRSRQTQIEHNEEGVHLTRRRRKWKHAFIRRKKSTSVLVA